jgi:hypothetical protein
MADELKPLSHETQKDSLISSIPSTASPLSRGFFALFCGLGLLNYTEGGFACQAMTGYFQPSLLAFWRGRF